MNKLNLTVSIMTLLGMILGCGTGSDTEWTKSRKIAGSEQKISGISGLIVDDKFAYVTTGGNLADQSRGLSGLRKVALETGAVTILDDGKTLPQSEAGGIAEDEKFVYWNAEGSIMRVSKDGGKSETVVSENVGVGIDMVLDGGKIYWTNHGYSSGNSDKLNSIYTIPTQGGKTEVFAALPQTPASLVADEKFVYWVTSNGVWKQAKSGGQPQAVYQTTEENIDLLSQDADNLYFGFRPGNSPRWGLRKVSKQGGESQILVKEYSLKPVAVDDANVYFFDEHSSYKDDLCKMSKNGGEITKLDYGYSGGTIAQSKTSVYLTSLNVIYSLPK